MITIIADPYDYRGTMPHMLHAKSSGDYIRVRMAIRRALNSGENLSVHVTDHLLMHWLEDLKEYEGVRWDHATPEADYRRIFGMNPPPALTPDVLIALDIANISIPPHGKDVDPIAWILGERLHQLWAAPSPGATHLAQLITWTIARKEPLPANLHPLAQQRLAVWAMSEPAYAQFHAGSLAADAIHLLRCIALQRYERAWLAERGLTSTSTLTITVEGRLWREALADLTPAIEQYWQERFAKTTPESSSIRGALQRMSGWSSAEWRAMEYVLRRTPTILDDMLIQTLCQQFAELPEALRALDELETLVPPRQPTLPDETWNDDQWLRWATNDYLPYFAWCIRAREPRDHQMACARAYETWLFNRYPAWLTSTNSPLITRQFTLLRDLIAEQPNATIVWLVIDGMTWWQGRLFRDICRQHGLYPQQYEPGVALLPSLTSISKRALVTGMPITEAFRTNIAQAASEKLERAGLHGYVSYNEQQILAKLQDAEPPQYILWLSNTLDRLAHDRREFADDSVVRGYMEGLVRSLEHMQALCQERGRPFHVLVGSDHGSTLLPTSTPLRHPPSATQEIVEAWEEHESQQPTEAVSSRALAINDSQQPRIDHPDEWHHLARVPFQLPHDYLVPQGYAAVGRRPSGWTHGGLTPEETIVPLLHLAPKPLAIQNLIVTISGQLRARQDGLLFIQLVNPNRVRFDRITLQIANIPPLHIEYLTASGRYETTLNIPAPLINGSELALHWELDGNTLGIEHRQYGETRIAVRRLQTGNDFDDLFG